VASILNNVAALGASRQLGHTASGLQKTIERLTTGRRINRASDDAAGLGISDRLGMDIRVASQGKRNANDGISYLQVADGILEEVTNLLDRAGELTQQAKTGTISDSNRIDLDIEFQNIIRSISDIGQNTKFNGTVVFTTSTLVIAVGSFSPVSVTVGTISATTTSALGLTATTDNITNSVNAGAVADKIASAIDIVSNIRATIGASQQQLAAINNSLGVQVDNFTAAFAQIRDADIADEVVNLTKFQILNQSTTNALSQANQAAQGILMLLK